MKDISSAKFRKTYPRLTEPVAITVLGRVIGHYVPINSMIDDRFVAGLRPGESPTLRRDLVATQSQRDAILRKINKGG